MSKKKRKALTVQDLENSSKSALTSRDPSITERRVRAAAFKAKGLSYEMIAFELAQEGFTTAAGEQFSSSTIERDIAAVNDYWLAKSKEIIDHKRAEQLRDLDALIHEAWRGGKYHVVLRAIEMRMDLLGLKHKPQESSNAGENAFNLREFKGPLSVQYISNRFNELTKTARDRRTQLLESDTTGMETTSEAETGV